MNILHLEDSDAKAKVIERHLERILSAYALKRVICWKDYQRELYNEGVTYDLLLLDIQVPMFARDFPKDMGRASHSEARRTGHTGPIIFISGNPQGLDLSGDSAAQAYAFHDVAGWFDAIGVAQAEIEGGT